MAGAETKIVHACMVALSQAGARVFRNVRGMFYTLQGQPIRAGLQPNGASDIIGWYSITVTPDMVGCKVAVFTAIEVKTQRGRVRPEQQNYIDAVRCAGGIAGVARSAEDAVLLLDNLHTVQ